VVIGAPYDDGTDLDQGSAYVFDRTSSTWSPSAKLTASDPAPGARFGFSVGVDGARTVIGADRAGPGGDQSGAAYVLDLAAGTWVETTKVIASDSAPGDQFGYAVDLSGRIVIGAHLDDDRGNNAGAAYVFGP
jgi:hypothetical protein